ncbi:MAG: NADH-quinone oxidoreductase subunit L [Fibrobacterota bacterium]|nr:MAG: NADH-quinone oxidoreductase subunit L [Fibrobacterota bacterium]
MTNLLWLLPALPAFGFAINGLLALAGARRTEGPDRGIVGFLAVLFPVLSFLLTLVLWQNLSAATESVRSQSELLGVKLQAPAFAQTMGDWIRAGDLAIDFGFRFDKLTGIMLLFVTGIGSLIHLYSIGYMAHDRGFARFMAYLNLFLANMVVLVLGNGPIVTFLGWEGVGLCSYLLIGFWHHDEANGSAATKAFLVNRVGDLAFLVGIFLLWQIMGGPKSSLTYEAISAWFRDPLHASQLAVPAVAGLLTLSTLLLFVGCTGKSAQIPLLTWLPDAMAGPTPVSALIHAATMVTSGVFLLARMSDVFAMATTTLHVIAWVGALTAAWAAITGLFQHDIKKVLAYSTVSQLGFMFLAAGVGAFDAGIFHVFTHAFFKAVLFLGAGSVIHALSGEQDIRRMGGLVRKLPVTFAAMFAGWYAIVGLPFGAGFWSKDLILERVYVHGGMGLYAIALGSAVITAVYMTRMMILVFWSPSRVDEEVSHHIHESPLSMQVPLWILGVGALCVGFFWADMIHLDWFARQLEDVVGPAQVLLVAHGSTHGPSPWLLAAFGVTAAVVGIAIAFGLFRNGAFRENGREPMGTGPRWWMLAFDGLHTVVGIWPVSLVSWVLDNWIQPLLMGVLRVFGWLVELTGSVARLFQRSRLRTHMALSILGLALLLLFLARELL